MLCPQQENSDVKYVCDATYCPPSSNSNAPGNFSVSVCAFSMVKRDNSSSELKLGRVICEDTSKMCAYSCDYLFNNISSLPSSFPEKKAIGDLWSQSLQTKIYVGCVPGNHTERNEFTYNSEIKNPPSLSSSNGAQLTGSLLLPMFLTIILLLKIKFV